MIGLLVLSIARESLQDQQASSNVSTPPLLISDDSDELLGRRVSNVSTPTLLISDDSEIDC